jgi:hypothetical protein
MGGLLAIPADLIAHGLFGALKRLFNRRQIDGQPPAQEQNDEQEIHCQKHKGDNQKRVRHGQFTPETPPA